MMKYKTKRKEKKAFSKRKSQNTGLEMHGCHLHTVSSRAPKQQMVTITCVLLSGMQLHPEQFLFLTYAYICKKIQHGKNDF